MRKLVRCVLVIPIAVFTSWDATAQTNGNVWDWRAHEPDPATVHSDERANGTFSQQQQDEETSEVEQLARKLLNQPANGPVDHYK